MRISCIWKDWASFLPTKAINPPDNMLGLFFFENFFIVIRLRKIVV